METTETNVNFPKQVNIRLRSGDKEVFELAARSQRKNVTEWSRDVLLEATKASPIERRLMRFFAFQSEINRLSLAAVQEGENIAADSVRQRIETQAKASAEGLMIRWLATEGGI